MASFGARRAEISTGLCLYRPCQSTPLVIAVDLWLCADGQGRMSDERVEVDCGSLEQRYPPHPTVISHGTYRSVVYPFYAYCHLFRSADIGPLPPCHDFMHLRGKPDPFRVGCPNS